ncbi:MAG: phosphoglycerate dehydrogenase [Oligoflexia bacterium]|nr:phosphoglycerate dehydrogenase [Oligoflexia bacterium]MBF0367424.1 phosphoglycerate dehydrogenase [Oligoflexia bacterium]
MKVLISTLPFGEYNSAPLDLLKKHGLEVIASNRAEKFSREELKSHLYDIDFLIAGTELLDNELLKHAPKLKAIARVGIGLDNVDFNYTNQNSITVTYTPDAPSLSVAELTVGLMLDLARTITFVDTKIKKGKWHRYTGVLLQEKTLGIVGLGRIGKLLVKLIKPFGMKILVHDIEPDYTFAKAEEIELVSKETIVKQSDFLSLHIPLYSKTINYIDQNEFSLMKKDSFLINTSRGGIINESALVNALFSRKIAGVALDVFSEEPYNKRCDSPLLQFDNVVFTAHMGSCTKEGRYQMEFEAAKSIIDLITGNNSPNIVTASTYQ